MWIVKMKYIFRHFKIFFLKISLICFENWILNYLVKQVDIKDRKSYNNFEYGGVRERQ